MKIFNLPDLGEGLAEAEIREWYVKAGDTVKVDQPLVSMETAKAVVDVPSPYAGKISKLHGAANEIIKTGEPLVTYEIEEEETEADKGSVVGKLETSEKKWDEDQVIIGGAKQKSQSIKAMPAARVLANQLNVDLSLLTPTGRDGLITVNDVKLYMEKNSSSAKQKLPGKSESLHGVRRVMAQIMAESHKEVVPVTIIEDVDISHLTSKTDLTVSMLKAIVAAVKAEPALNAWFDGRALERKLWDEINIGVAVDTEEGLFVPVIKNAGTLSDKELRQAVDNYKQSVRSRTILTKDLQDATITLSNYGTIAGRYATPIIVPPAVSILGCGRSRDTVIPREGQIVVGKILPLSLTFDHRAVTGGEATRFLEAVIKYLQLV